MKNKNVLIYIILVILIILLLLPPALRFFAKDLYGSKKVKPTIVVEVLSCTKLNETINTSYVNGSPHNFQYQVLDSNSLGDNNNSIVNDIINYAIVNKSELNGVTEYRIELNKYVEFPLSIQNYAKSIDKQSEFYEEIGFSCNKTRAD